MSQQRSMQNKICMRHSEYLVGKQQGIGKQQQGSGKQQGMQSGPKSEPCYVLDQNLYQGSNKLKDYVALITGGDHGIGRAVAALYAREGAHVAIIYDKDDSAAEETKNLVRKEGGKFLSFRGDIGDKNFCNDAVQRVMNKFGRLDVLVNCECTVRETSNLNEISEKQLLKTFRKNVFSLFYLTQASLPHLTKSPNPSVINVTSTAALHGPKNLMDFAASKAAVSGFSRSIAKNLAKQGIRVNMVSPGPIWTGSSKQGPGTQIDISTNTLEKFAKKSTLHRLGHPDEVAPAFVFLASPESSYMTGQTIKIDGGYL